VEGRIEGDRQNVDGLARILLRASDKACTRRAMIHLTRLNNDEVLVNSDLIVFVESTPDTVISLNTGERLRVRESLEEVVARVIEFKRRIMRGAWLVEGGRSDG
jgi:flagellar protein FlbD